MAVEAHKPSDAYLNLSLDDQSISLRMDLALRDLNYLVGLDDNGDSSITWGEVKAHKQSIESYALTRFLLSNNGALCHNAELKHMIDKHSDGAYLVLLADYHCETKLKDLKLVYNLFFDLDPQHKGLININYATPNSAPKQTSFVFDDANRSFEFSQDSFSFLGQFKKFVILGVEHIWAGIDHVLFLLALLFSSVLVRKNLLWEPSDNFKSSFWKIFKIVTSFTIAHSITLSLASLGFISFNSKLIESIIALSVAIAAWNNIKPISLPGEKVLKDDTWLIAFAFGLIHGFGFASVLADLGLSEGSLLTPLFGFNLGVEIGQLAIVLVFVPIAFTLRKTKFYDRFVLKLGSWLIIAIALVWFVERLLG